jgi:hypothetical protein
LAHQVNQQLPAAQLFDRKDKSGDCAVIADADAPDRVEIAH